MRKTGIVCFLIVGILLSGCSRKSPEAAPDDGCLTLGTSLEVVPMEGWILLRNEDVLAAEGMYYAQWTSGEEATYKSEDGTQITAHGGEIHLVIVESEDPDVLQTNARQWIALTQERYPEAESKKSEFAGQSYTVDTYQTGYARCASATGVREGLALRVDVTVLSGFQQEPGDLLEAFLNSLHYVS